MCRFQANFIRIIGIAFLLSFGESQGRECSTSKTLSQTSEKTQRKDYLNSFIEPGLLVDNGTLFGTTNLFVPIFQKKNGEDINTVAFGTFQGGWSKHPNQQLSFGIGVRHLILKGIIFGLHGSFDKTRVSPDGTFSMATLSGEIKTELSEFRANIYMAQSKKPSASIPISIQKIPLSGVDGEIGHTFDLPFSNTSLDIFGGGYRFQAKNTRTIMGPKARVELNISDSFAVGSLISLTAEAQKDRVNGNTFYFSTSVRIPLQIYKNPPNSSHIQV